MRQRGDLPEDAADEAGMLGTAQCHNTLQDLLSSWTKIFMHIRILTLIDTYISKPLLAATLSNRPR
jgi:hypothetical protein